MKKYNYIIALLFTCVVANAQVAIEKDATGNPSVLLEFNDARETTGENKALILPIVSTISANSVEGTIWFDASDNKVKYKSASANVDMTGANTAGVKSPAQADSNLSELPNAKGVIIGADASNAPGVLVLESTDKVMVLPHVNGVNNVLSPEPGAMVYDKNEKAIAVFNGEKWYFWGSY